jgi:hypothetical protein
MPKSTELHYSLEIFNEQISKAYGQAVSHNLVHNPLPTRPNSANPGLGAIVVSRKIPFGSLDKTTHAVIGRPECITSTRFDKVMDSTKLRDLLFKYQASDRHQLQEFINENFYCASGQDPVTLDSVGPPVDVKTTLTDVFVVKKQKKDKKIRFVGTESHKKRALTFTNTGVDYEIYFSLDREFESVALCRIVPVATASEFKSKLLWVHESLIIFNSLKYCVAECVPYPGSVASFSDKDPTITALLSKQKAELLNGDTVRFLRAAHPLRLYFPRGAGGKLQNKASIPYVKDFLENLSRLHYAYNAMTAISAAMSVEQRPVATKSRKSVKGGSIAASSVSSSKSAKNAETKTELDRDIVALRASIRDVMLGMNAPDVEYCKDVEKIYECIAAVAHYVSIQYKELVKEETTETNLQLEILSLVDSNASQWKPDKIRDNYGYLLVRSLLKSIPVVTQNMEHTNRRNRSSPLEVNIHEVTPYLASTDYGDAWTLKIYYAAYHRQFLNLAPWVSSDGKTFPAWMKQYTTHSILDDFDATKIGSEPIYERVVPTRLNYDQKIEVTVHTFLCDVDGARVRNDKKRTPAS